MKKVITIEPARVSPRKQTHSHQERRRVAGYARVSTDHDDQASSYEAQMTYYTNYITQRPDWEFVKMYSDEGISGTSTKARLGFQGMVQDALDGKIDLIITKSVSRFARNTVDSLSTVRQLKEAGVEIYFEKENIWTFDSKGELLITIMSSLAQEESRSISENVIWGRRKQLAQGQVTFSYSNVLGFRKSPQGGFEVDPEQAKVVRYIFQQILLGSNPNRIARELTEKGIPTPGGKSKWSYATVKRMLRNEKYKGDALLQKSYTVDFLTKKQKVNEGELPQYYVENSHEAIIDRRTFDLVQIELDKREHRRQTDDVFLGKIICGTCGASFGSKVWHSTSKYRRRIFRCNAKYKGDEPCPTPHVTEEEIKAWSLQAINRLLDGKAEVMTNLDALIDMVSVDKSLEETISRHQEQLVKLNEQIDALVADYSRTEMSKDSFEEQYEQLVSHYDNHRKELQDCQEQLKHRQQRLSDMTEFRNQLQDKEELVTEFSQVLWQTLIDQLIIGEGKVITVQFRDGSQIEL